MDMKPLETLTATGKALAHPTRLRILAMLRGGELCVCQMIAVLGLAPSTVSAHLRDLRAGSLVEDRKKGKLVFYWLGEGSPADHFLDGALAFLENDPQIIADASLVGQLRKISVSDLCAANLDLAACGVATDAVPRTPHSKRSQSCKT